MLFDKENKILPDFVLDSMFKLQEVDKTYSNIKAILSSREQSKISITAYKQPVTSKTDRFNSMQSTDESTVETTSSFLYLMPNFKRGEKSVLKDVAAHNDKFLGRFSREQRNSFAMDKDCWTCGRTGHLVVDCPSNVGKTPPFPMPHKPETFKDFEDKKKPFSRYKFKQSRFHVILDNDDVDQEEFIWVGPPDLDGVTDCETCPDQLFLLC